MVRMLYLNCIVSFGRSTMGALHLLLSLTLGSNLVAVIAGTVQCPVTNTTCHCPEANDTCYFELTVEHKLTMMYGNKLVYPLYGKLYYDNGTKRIQVNCKYLAVYQSVC